MKAEYINPFIEATVDVFKTMLGAEVDVVLHRGGVHPRFKVDIFEDIVIPPWKRCHSRLDPRGIRDF